MSAPVNVLAVLGEMESFMATSYPSYDSAEKLRAARAAVAELIKALAGLVSIEDSVTQGQERERREEWIPKARAILSRVGGAS
jgi:hypothetical protein